MSTSIHVTMYNQLFCYRFIQVYSYMHNDVKASMQLSGEWSLLIVGNNIACTGKYIVNLFLVWQSIHCRRALCDLSLYPPPPPPPNRAWIIYYAYFVIHIYMLILNLSL